MGWNSHTQEGILPDHDIELAFDVRFDVEDIAEVAFVSLILLYLLNRSEMGSHKFVALAPQLSHATLLNFHTCKVETHGWRHIDWHQRFSTDQKLTIKTLSTPFALNSSRL